MQNNKHINAIGSNNHYPYSNPMTHKHPEFQWSNHNDAENLQRFFSQK